WRADSRIRGAAGDVLRECLVGCELAKRDRRLEYSDGLVDQRAGADAGPAKIESRLVLGPARRVCSVRGKLALARDVQSGDRLRSSAGCALVFGSTSAPN